MYKKYISLLIFIVCAALASCDASFTVPNPVNPNAIPLLNTKTNSYPLTGYVLSSFERCRDTLPLGARIIVAWEMPNTAQKQFYVYGTGTVNDTLMNIPYIPTPPPPFNKGYRLDVTIDSNLPRVVFWPNADSANVIAVGHLFLTTNQYIKNADTLSYSNFIESDDILGGVEETAVVYIKGTPLLFNKPIGNATPTHQGYNFLRGYKNFPDPSRFSSSIDSSYAKAFYLTIENDRDGTELYNPFWLKP